MPNEFEPDLIGLIDEDGKEYSFEILDVIEENGRTFFALCPAYEGDEEGMIDDDEYIIMEQIIENEDAVIAEVEDEDLLDHLAEIFEEHFNEMFSMDADDEE